MKTALRAIYYTSTAVAGASFGQTLVYAWRESTLAGWAATAAVAVYFVWLTRE